MPIQAARRWPSILVMLLLIPGLAGADDVRIRSAVANVREEGSIRGRVLFEVKAGDILRLIDTAGVWLHVETPDGRRGYVSKTLAEVIPSAPARTDTPAAAPAPAPPAAGSLVIAHDDVGCIVGDRYPRLDACFQPAGDLGNAKVLFRAADGPWYSVDLMPEGACHVAYLPKPLATTTEIEYYVAAVDTAFNERQRPETAPDPAYRARVVRNQGDCEALKRVAASVQRVAKPIVVAAARTRGGAPAVLGALLVGFSQEGVILAATATAAGAGGAAAGASAGTAGSGGGIGTGTLAVAGGVVAAGALVAAVAGGGGEEGPECSAAQIARSAPGGEIVATDDQTICSSEGIACGRPGLTLRSCVGGVCTNSCSVYYLLSDGRRFTCGSLANCTSGAGSAITDPTFCLSAAQQVVQACGG